MYVRRRSTYMCNACLFFRGLNEVHIEQEKYALVLEKCDRLYIIIISKETVIIYNVYVC